MIGTLKEKYTTAPERIVSARRGWRTAHAQTWLSSPSPQGGGLVPSTEGSPPLPIVRSADEAGRCDKMLVTVSHKEVNSGTQQPRKVVFWTAEMIVQTPSSKENQSLIKKGPSPSENSSLPFGVEAGILGP